MVRQILLCCLLLTASAFAKPLDIYFIDVEGGQATLIVSPSGQSMLVDVGWPGFNGRDGDRILQTAKKAKLKQIDYVLISHYHTDHVGGVEQLVDRMKVGTFITHGPNTETGKNAEVLNGAYQRALKASGAKELIVKPGDTIPLKGPATIILPSSASFPMLAKCPFINSPILALSSILVFPAVSITIVYAFIPYLSAPKESASF